jgi:conjugative transfer pilus assembly protein TraH
MLNKKLVWWVLALFLGFTLLVCPLGPEVSDAGWVDDWLQQKTETSLGYFEGQKRGYFTGGSFSARWQQSNDYLFTAMPPKVKAGCGGIDVFLGGFSYLNFEYLVTKLQRIMQAAPAAAFDIALNVLCEPCSKTIKSLEAITNTLNNLQLDECKSSRALVATVVPPSLADAKDRQAKLAGIQGDFLQSSGINDLWKSINDQTNANTNKPIADMKQALAGCPADIKDVFGTTGSVINNIAAKTGFNNPAYLDMLRGLIGDISIIDAGNAGYQVGHTPPCEENRYASFDNFLDGSVYARAAGGICARIGDNSANLTDYVRTKMNRITGRMKAKQPLMDEDSAFVDASPLSIGLVLKAAVGTNQEASVISTLSDVTAKAYAFQLLSDLYTKAWNIMEKARSLAQAQTGATQGEQEHRCKIEMLSGAIDGTTEMQAKIVEMVSGVRKSYAASVQEVMGVYNLVDKMEKFDKLANSMLSSKFGSAVAARTLSH